MARIKHIALTTGLSSATIVFYLVAISASVWATSPGTNGRIAFASDRDGDLHIWTINPDGSGAFNVTATAGAPGFNLEPAWSPNGTKIAFRNGRASAAEIYTVNADGTGLAQHLVGAVESVLLAGPHALHHAAERAFASSTGYLSLP